jgi:hypothetical protein
MLHPTTLPSPASATSTRVLLSTPGRTHVLFCALASFSHSHPGLYSRLQSIDQHAFPTAVTVQQNHRQEWASLFRFSRGTPQSFRPCRLARLSAMRQNSHSSQYLRAPCLGAHGRRLARIGPSHHPTPGHGTVTGSHCCLHQFGLALMQRHLDMSQERGPPPSHRAR